MKNYIKIPKLYNNFKFYTKHIKNININKLNKYETIDFNPNNNPSNIVYKNIKMYYPKSKVPYKEQWESRDF